MEWVETTGRTVDEAKEAALDRLGVAPEDAEFEVLEEPKPGLFGRTRGEARVRARVRPAQVRQKVDRRRRSTGGEGGGAPARRQGRGGAGDGKGGTGKGGNGANGNSTRRGGKGAPRAASDEASSDADGETSTRRPARTPAATSRRNEMVDTAQVGAAAQQFMSGLLDAFGLTGTVEVAEDGDDLEVRVHGEHLGLLVGPRGTTLQAVQDLARVAAQRRLGDHDTRLRVDVGGYRERRREALGRFALQMADEVRASGVARVLEPMSSADRKIIHDALAGQEGLVTRSEGDDPQRRVVISPVAAGDD
ncbi:MAG: RNA-binding cell elongation regulator Jag/EloR [Ilumatobacteraceae bacterium]